MRYRWDFLSLAVLLGLACLSGCRSSDTRTASNTREFNDVTDAGNLTAANTDAGNLTDGNANTGATDREGGVNTGQSGTTPITQAEGQAVEYKIKNALMTSRQKLNWKNVKISTKDNLVILRGMVGSPDERFTIENTARQAAGNRFQIRNELQVKSVNGGS